MNDMTSITTHRPARLTDAPQLAWFLNTAGEGMPLEFWTSLAKPGQDPWDVGAARISEETGDNSWRHWTVAERDGRVAGGLCSFELSPQPQEITPDTAPMFRPLIELENLVRGSWNIHVLATANDARRSGVGRALLAHAAYLCGDRKQSIIVDSGNAPARKLYASVGFREIARRPILDEDGGNKGGDWRLLVR